MHDLRRIHGYPVAIALLLLSGTVACSDTIADANALVGPARIAAVRSVRGQGSTLCAALPTVVVTTEPALNAALAASSPGDVIAIGGTIALTHDLEVRTAGVTLTCSQPGDGLAVSAAASQNVDATLAIFAADVTVQGLAIDARYAGEAIYVEAIPGYSDGRRAQIAGNDMQCGAYVCVFVVGPGARITNNTLTSAIEPSLSGIHLQNGPDSSQVEGNQMIALSPQGARVFGAIRAVGGKEVVIRDNVITGPWSNGLALAGLLGGIVEGNTISGAHLNGLYVAYGNNHAVSVRGVLFRGNTSTAEGPALYVDDACGNAFVANRLATAGTGPVATFALNTGANALLGDNRGGVVDNGNVDCDGDGIIDPNMISGAKHGGSTPPGAVIGPVMRNFRGIVIQ